MAAEFFHADLQTNIMKPIAASRSFVKASKENLKVWKYALFLSPQSKPYFLLRKSAPYSKGGIMKQTRDTYTTAYNVAHTSLLWTYLLLQVDDLTVGSKYASVDKCHIQHTWCEWVTPGWI